MADRSQLETLGKAVRAWNKWRVESPAIIPNLERGKLEGIKLHGADLRSANLRGADFTKAEGISGANFGGANLADAILPNDFCFTNQIGSVQDTVKYA